MTREIETVSLLIMGTTLGVSGELLDQIDLIAGIALKVVSIISFLTVIIINWKKIKTKVLSK